MKYFFASLVFVSVLGFAPYAFGADGLVTCDGVAVKGVGVSCDFCKFVEMVHKVTKFLVGILIIISVIMLAITGIQMAYLAAGGSDALTVLKDRMTNIVIGFVIILGAWVIVDTLLKALVTDGQIRNNWMTPIAELCGLQHTPSESVTAVEGPESTVVSAADLAGNAGEVRDAIDAMGNVTVNKSECPAGTNFRDVAGGCTSVGGMSAVALGTIDTLSDSYSSMVITGGTEIGHTNPCHISGTCYDTVVPGISSGSDVNAFVSRATAAGATNVVYEVRTEAERTALVNSGASPRNVAVISWATGNHFSVYTQ